MAWLCARVARREVATGEGYVCLCRNRDRADRSCTTRLDALRARRYLALLRFNAWVIRLRRVSALYSGVGGPR